MEFSIKGFRGISDQVNLRIAPITLLIGPNSSGKSSATRALVCNSEFREGDFKSATFSRDTANTLELYNGELVNKVVDSIEFIQQSLDFDVVLKVSEEGLVTKVSSYELICRHGKKNKVFELKINDGGYQAKLSKHYVLAWIQLSSNSEKIRSLDFNNIAVIGHDDEILPGFDDVLETISRVRDGQDPEDNSDMYIWKGDFTETIYTKVSLNLRSVFKLGFHQFAQAVRDDGHPLQDLIKALSKIEDHGALQVSHYPVKGRIQESRSIGPSHVLWHTLITRANKEFEDAWNIQSRSVIATFLRSAKLPEFVKVIAQQDGSLVVQIGAEFLHNLGQGHRMAINILFQVCHEMEKYLPDEVAFEIDEIRIKAISDRESITRIVIIEEPESNLHPAAQSEILSAIVNILLSIQKNPEIGQFAFVLETHSEYIVRSLQLAVKEGIIDREAVSLQYFERGESVQIREIKISEDGLLEDEFGSGFYDQSIIIMKQLFS
jgi:predicted ATP-dependent endonuclease of OLD family